MVFRIFQRYNPMEDFMKTIASLVLTYLLFNPTPGAAQTPTSLPEMLTIPGGTCQMGSRAGDADEKPLHAITLSSFYLARTETTFAQFQAFITATHYTTEAERGDGSFIWDSIGWHKEAGINWRHDERGLLRSKTRGDFGQCPVLHVSWNDAARYCNWLSVQSGLPEVYDFQGDSATVMPAVSGYHLPTEAEWEYAAAEGKLEKAPPYSGSGSLNGLGWYSGNSRHRVHPAALLKANALGLYDLTGNVWEWCQDWYDPHFYEKSSGTKDPAGPTKGRERALRGGSWNNNRAHCRSANRSSRYADFRDGSVGFRVAR